MYVCVGGGVAWLCLMKITKEQTLMLYVLFYKSIAPKVNKEKHNTYSNYTNRNKKKLNLGVNDHT